MYSQDCIRCPMCLKLVKNIKSVDQLPVNHTFYMKILGTEGVRGENAAYLCTEFTLKARERVLRANPVEADPAMEFSACPFHREQTQHFFCIGHEVPGCRTCMEIAHKTCRVIDVSQMQQS